VTTDKNEGLNKSGNRRGMTATGQQALTPGNPTCKHGLYSLDVKAVRETIETAVEALQDGQGLDVLGQAALVNAMVRGESFMARAFRYLDSIEAGAELVSAGNLRALQEVRQWATLYLELLKALHQAGLGEKTLSLRERIAAVRREEGLREQTEGDRDV
jgi:hypothetical protein